MEAAVQVIAEDPITGEQVHTNNAYLVYVALDHTGTHCPRAPAPGGNPQEQDRRPPGSARQTASLPQTLTLLPQSEHLCYDEGGTALLSPPSAAARTLPPALSADDLFCTFSRVFSAKRHIWPESAVSALFRHIWWPHMWRILAILGLFRHIWGAPSDPMRHELFRDCF
jgi:acyl-CoA hydrolase